MSTVRAASEPQVQLADGETAVSVTGRIGEDTTFVRRFGAVAAAPRNVQLRVSDLAGPDGARIGRQLITVTPANPISLVKGVPKDLEITIAGVKRPGVYTGTIRFESVTDGVVLGRAILTVNAQRIWTLASLRDVKIQRIDCVSVGCAIAFWLDPSATHDQYWVQFNNPTSEAFTVTGAIETWGEQTRQPANIALSSPIAVPAAPQFSVPLSPPGGVPPDRYVGEAQFRVSGQDSVLKVPVEMNVRSGPLGAVVVLLVGIILGRIAKYMKDHGTAQSDLLLAVYRLEDRVALAPDRAILQPMIEDAKQKVYELKIEAATIDLTAIEKRLVLLETLRSLEGTLAPHQADPAVAAILTNIDGVRALVAARRDADAEARVAQIQRDVAALNTAAVPAGGPAFTTASSQAKIATVAAGRAFRAAAVARTLPLYVRALSRLTGVTAAARAELSLWVARPLLYCLLLLGVLIVGIQQLYLKNPVFGSNPISDHFGLMVWAMSADVASRTISTLKGGA